MSIDRFDNVETREEQAARDERIVMADEHAQIREEQAAREERATMEAEATLIEK